MKIHKGLAFALFMVLLLVLTGCNTSQPAQQPAGEKSSQTEQNAPAESKEPVVIKVLAMQQAGYTADEMDEIANRFSKENPNIKIEVTYLSYDEIYDKLVTSFSSSETAFDIFLVDDPWYTQFAEAGWLLDITDRVSPEYKNGIMGSAWNITTVNDKIYGMPWMIDAKMFFYNKEILKKAGYDAPPTTWEELAEMGKTIKEKGLVEYPIVWSWAQAEASVCDFVLLVAGNNGTFFDKDGNPVFNNEAGVEALTWMVDSINSGLSNPASITSVEEDVRSVFSQGNAAFAVNWPYMYELSQFNKEESLITGKVGLALIPVFEKGKKAGLTTVTTNGSMGFSLAANSKHADEAWKYLEFLSSKDIQIEYAAHLPPVWKTAYQAEALEKLKSASEASADLVPVFAQQYPHAVMRPRIPYYTDASTKIQLALQEALTGQKTPQQALDDAVAAINDLKK